MNNGGCCLGRELREWRLTGRNGGCVNNGGCYLGRSFTRMDADEEEWMLFE